MGLENVILHCCFNIDEVKCIFRCSWPVELSLLQSIFVDFFHLPFRGYQFRGSGNPHGSSWIPWISGAHKHLKIFLEKINWRVEQWCLQIFVNPLLLKQCETDSGNYKQYPNRKPICRHLYQEDNSNSWRKVKNIQ